MISSQAALAGDLAPVDLYAQIATVRELVREMYALRKAHLSKGQEGASREKMERLNSMRSALRRAANGRQLAELKKQIDRYMFLPFEWKSMIVTWGEGEVRTDADRVRNHQYAALARQLEAELPKLAKAIGVVASEPASLPPHDHGSAAVNSRAPVDEVAVPRRDAKGKHVTWAKPEGEHRAR